MPRARKEYDPTGYPSQGPTSERQAFQQSDNVLDVMNGYWNGQYNRFSGGPQYPSRGRFSKGYHIPNQRGFYRPNQYRNSVCYHRGTIVHQNGWNTYEEPDFASDHSPEWQQESRREPSYRASCFTTFDNCPYPIRYPLQLSPLLSESGVTHPPNIRTEQDKTGKVNIHPDVTKPESYNVEVRSLKTDTKLDFAQACTETKTSSDAKVIVKSDDIDKDPKTTDQKNLVDRKVDIQTNTDKIENSDPMKTINKIDMVSCPDSTTPEPEARHSFRNKLPAINAISEKTLTTCSRSENQAPINVIDLTTDDDIFENAPQAQSQCESQCNSPLQSQLGHTREDKESLLVILNNIQAAHNTASPRIRKERGANAKNLISLPLYIPPLEDKSDKSSPNVTANKEIVQVSTRGHCEDTKSAERRESIDDYTQLLRETRKEDRRRKEERKRTASPIETDRYIIEDVDMRVPCATSRSSDYIGTKQMSMSPIAKSKDRQLSPTTVESKLVGRTKKDTKSKIGADAVSAKERKYSMEEPSVPQVAADVHREETFLKDKTRKRISSSSSDTSDCKKSDRKRSKLQASPTPEKGTHSQKESSKSGGEEMMLEIVVKRDGITNSIKKATSTESQSNKSVTNASSLVMKEKTNEVSKSEAKHRSSKKTSSNINRVVDGKGADGAQQGSVSTNNPDGGHTANSKEVDKNKKDNLPAKVKDRKDSNAPLQKSSKHLSSRKQGSESEQAVKVAASSNENNSNLNKSDTSPQKRSEQKTQSSNNKKLVSQKSSVKASAEILTKNSSSKKAKNENTENCSTLVNDQNSLSKLEKDSLKRKRSSDKKLKSDHQKKLKTVNGELDLDSSTSNEKVGTPPKKKTPTNELEMSKKISVPATEKSLVVNGSKATGSSENILGKPIYKMTHKEWIQMGKPSVDFLKVNVEKNEVSEPTLEVCPSSMQVPDVSSPATLSVAVEMEKLSEQEDASCKSVIQPAESVPPQMVVCDSTDVTENEGEPSSTINATEIDDKSLIVRFQGHIDNISEAHTPIITLCDDDVSKPVLTVGITSTVFNENSDVDPKTVTDSDINNLNLKQEMELTIDDSNFLSNIKEELNTEAVHEPAEDVVGFESPHAPQEGLLVLPFNYGSPDTTKLVEYFISLNQDLIKFNDSYRIASRLNDIQRTLEERRANRDLSLVIHNVKPIVEKLISSIKTSISFQSDLLEFIYIYKEVLPCEALKFKADTLSRKAIADIFRLISDGMLDDMVICSFESVIVCKAEQGQIPPNPRNMPHESVIRSLSPIPIEQNENRKCEICCQRHMTQCR